MKAGELAKEYDVTAMTIGRIRKKFNPEESGDLSEESVEFIRTYFSGLQEDEQSMEELVKPRIVDSLCSYTQDGRHEVECKVMSEGGVKTVRALIPHMVAVTQLRGRPMPLEVIDHKGVEYYRHASLAGKAWSNI